MREDGRERSVKEAYAAPAVLATYSKDELERAVRPHGPMPSYGTPDQGCGGGCGCGGGSILT